PDAHQAGLTKYLLGNAATILHQDFYMICLITFVSICSILLFFKKYQIILFDFEYAQSCNHTTRMISNIVLVLTTTTIMIGLQTVGVILISALLIAPATAARQWSHNFTTIIFLAAFFGLLSTTLGTLISSSMPHLPTGPTIVMIACFFTFFSLLFAPNGIVIAWCKKKEQIKKMNATCMLSNFLLFNEGLQDPFHAHDLAALQALGKKGTNKIIDQLEKQGLIMSPQKNFWRLTPKGLDFLEKHKNHA
ncbi:hypothetical protein A3J41_02360, partial [candidate division TM6 bacterium RIFCSPHIGHO2_12_FULL_38_8]